MRKLIGSHNGHGRADGAKLATGSADFAGWLGASMEAWGRAGEKHAETVRPLSTNGGCRGRAAICGGGLLLWGGFPPAAVMSTPRFKPPMACVRSGGQDGHPPLRPPPIRAAPVLIQAPQKPHARYCPSSPRSLRLSGLFYNLPLAAGVHAPSAAGTRCNCMFRPWVVFGSNTANCATR